MSESTKSLADAEPGVVALLEVMRPEADAEMRDLTVGSTVRIGRDKTNDLVISEGGVSRFHALISVSRSGVVLSDLSSLNGTHLDGHRISAPHHLGIGDIFKIGSVEFKVKRYEDNTIGSSFSSSRTLADKMRSVFVTVVVADVVSYTKLSKELPPNDVAGMLETWFQRVTSIVGEYGGEVDKFIGDCVMAFWVGTDKNTCASDALRAGMKILEHTKILAEDEWNHQKSHTWDCRVAMNSGEALLGTLGSRGAHDFTILGDTVNVTFRLQDAGGMHDQPLTLSATTAELVSDWALVEKTHAMELPERDEPIYLYRVLDQKLP